jgi:hypothetical protein
VDLSSFVGKKVILDYKTSSGRAVYAKGILISVEGTKIAVGGSSRFWLIDISMILSCRVTNGEKVKDEEPESYLRGDEKGVWEVGD